MELLLNDISLNRNSLDHPIWCYDSRGCFSVKTCFAKLLQENSYPTLDESSRESLKWMWEAKVPQKVKLFGWRILQNKVATRDQLGWKGIIVGSNNCRCVLCNEKIESIDHLFLSCNLTRRIWLTVYYWLEITNQQALDNSGDSCCNHFSKFWVVMKGKVSKGREWSVWLATV